jgi:hypothetical protein
MNRLSFPFLCCLTLAALCAVRPSGVRAEPPKGKVKVFILAGQSNMQGKGSIKHLEELVKAEPDKYGHLMKDGKWTERDDVWIFYGDLGGRDRDRKGRLTVGYGLPKGRFGPELGFGKVVGDAIEEPVLILKTCWGGQSLAVDFRPPSAGKWDKPFNPDDGVKWKPATTGWAYKQIFNEKHNCLDNLAQNFPELAGREYEIAGLVWFQGWNDLIDKKKVAEYQDNLAHFVRDIRKDLKVARLPIVIGVMGQDGDKAKANMLAMRKAQTDVAEMPEFKGSVVAVPTACYWDPTTKYDGGYHYNGSARFFYSAGEAMGNAMLGLLKEQAKK